MTKLNYSFTDVELLNTALTHSSFVRGDNRIYPNNERMEFLGDAVLELCASEYLYLNYPKMNEGMMTRTRARTVCESALNIVAKELELGKYLLLSHGEENTGGREKPSILSDALEAVIGSIFLDGGIECMSVPDHKRVFTMCVSIDGVVYGFGDGGTKQEAGQNAARATLELLNRDNA